MESFLTASKTALANLSSYKRIRVVMGNQTCDLDSAVCALILGLSEYLDEKKKNAKDVAIIPLMNIPENEFRLKTEVVYYLQRHNVSSNLLIFRDHIDLKALGKDDGGAAGLEVVLVDHHVLPNEDTFLTESVVRVIDHRPRDPGWPWSGRRVQIEAVGSCATLVARRFLLKHPEALNAQLAGLLRGPILIDTCNFSREADRATPTDVETMNALERVEGVPSDRNGVFEEILAAKCDVSGLTLDELLIRDLKVAGGIPIVGLPLLVENYFASDRALRAVKDFAETKNSAIVILIGLEAKEAKIARDVAVFFASDQRLKEKITNALTSSRQPSLQLSLTTEIRDEAGHCGVALYKQGNLRATRKQILPIVRDATSALALEAVERP